MKSQIEKAIDSIEEYLNDCRLQAFSNSKIIVDRNEISGLLVDLRNQIPKEIEQYQKVVSSRDSILNNARDKAERMVKQAEAKRQSLVDESDIKKSAQAEANEIIEQAHEEAQKEIEAANAQADEIVSAAYDESDTVRQNAAQYMDDVLAGMQSLVASTLKITQNKFDAYFRSMSDLEDEIARNREEIHQDLPQDEAYDEEEEYPESESFEEYPEDESN